MKTARLIQTAFVFAFGIFAALAVVDTVSNFFAETAATLDAAA